MYRAVRSFAVLLAVVAVVSPLGSFALTPTLTSWFERDPTVRRLAAATAGQGLTSNWSRLVTRRLGTGAGMNAHEGRGTIARQPVACGPAGDLAELRRLTPETLRRLEHERLLACRRDRRVTLALTAAGRALGRHAAERVVEHMRRPTAAADVEHPTGLSNTRLLEHERR